MEVIIEKEMLLVGSGLCRWTEEVIVKFQRSPCGIRHDARSPHKIQDKPLDFYVTTTE
jgi:hypothetical protein